MQPQLIHSSYPRMNTWHGSFSLHIHWKLKPSSSSPNEIVASLILYPPTLHPKADECGRLQEYLVQIIKLYCEINLSCQTHISYLTANQHETILTFSLYLGFSVSANTSAAFEVLALGIFEVHLGLQARFGQIPCLEIKIATSRKLN